MNLTESMHLEIGGKSDGYTIKDTKQTAAYDTLCLICAELNIDLSAVNDVDFETAAEALGAACHEAMLTQQHLTIWFD